MKLCLNKLMMWIKGVVLAILMVTLTGCTHEEESQEGALQDNQFWDLKQIDAYSAWELAIDLDEVTVAVIGNGIAYNHPDLKGSMWDGSKCQDQDGDYLGGCVHGYDFYHNDKIPLPDDDDDHSTFAASIIKRVAPNAEIMALKEDDMDQVIKSIYFAKANGVKIIVMPGGWRCGGKEAEQDEDDYCECDFFWDSIDQSLYEAIKNFDGLFFAVNGDAGELHQGKGILDIPGDFGGKTECWQPLENIIVVASTDENDRLKYSDYGVGFVDIAAPGHNVLGAQFDEENNYKVADPDDISIYEQGYASGQSFSVNYAAGLAALLWGKDTNLSLDDIKTAIFDNGDTISNLVDKVTTGKRINAFKSIKSIDRNS